MTQAYNLAILANAVDSSGKLNVGTNATGTLPVANGGTGLATTPSNGQIDIGNGSGFTRTTITAGTNISVTNGAGTITIANTSTANGTVTSIATGNGLTGGTITTSGTISLDVYTGTNANNTSFPVGTCIMPGQDFGTYVVNSTCPTFYNNNQAVSWRGSNQGFGSLAGSWRWRGCAQFSEGACQVAQRVS